LSTSIAGSSPIGVRDDDVDGGGAEVVPGGSDEQAAVASARTKK
jgi:hypothetical protein